MASRKEQKEKLRIERERREAEAKAAERRKRLAGYGVGGGVALVAVIVVAVLLTSGGGGSEGKVDGSSDVLPEGGSVPEQTVTDLTEAARGAGCELRSFKAKSREHTGNAAEQIVYESSPPTSGKHFQEPTPDGAFNDAPDVKQLVHSLEHGRVVTWFKPSLPRDDRANIRSLFEEDEYQMILVPDTTRMKYGVAATAWNADPLPNGTGRLLGCPRMNPKVYDALRAFRDEHRGNGPEAIP
jgi:Protein of unknown function (DUF3105)